MMLRARAVLRGGMVLGGAGMMLRDMEGASEFDLSLVLGKTKKKAKKVAYMSCVCVFLICLAYTFCSCLAYVSCLYVLLKSLAYVSC